jgi:hypothetical protein
MPELSTLLTISASLVSFVGFSWIALTVGAHWKQVGIQTALTSSMRRRLRLKGTLSLLLALVLCMGANPPGMAILLWFLILSLAAMTVSMVIAWRPRSLCVLIFLDRP